jgi:hypothetical protein
VERDRLNGYTSRSLGSARWLPWLALALILLVIAGRMPAVWTSLRFWAEEADLFFLNAVFQPGVMPLVENPSLRAGYQNFWAAFSTWLAARSVPLELAPLVTTLCGALVPVAAALIAAFGPRRVLDRPIERAALVLIVFAFPYASGTAEAWLNSMNTLPYWGVLALLIAISDVSAEPRALRYAARLALVMGGLTGPYAVALAPVFLLQGLRRSQRENVLRSLLLGGCLLVQVASFAWAHAHDYFADQKSPLGLETFRLYAAAAFQFWQAVFGELATRGALHGFGWPAPDQAAALSNLALVVVVGIPILVVGWMVRAVIRADEGVTVSIALALWCVLTLLFSVNGIAGYRYAIAGPIAMGIVLLMASGDGRIRIRLPALLMLSIGIMSGFTEMLAAGQGHLIRNATVVHWSDQVAQWRKDPDYRLSVWPGGYFVNLPEPGRLAKLRAGVAALEPVSLDPAATLVIFSDADGLPAAFELAWRACPGNGQPAGYGLELLGEGDRTIAKITYSASECTEHRLNSMDLAFQGLVGFSATRTVRIVTTDNALSFDRFLLRSPVFRVVHPVSGR